MAARGWANSTGTAIGVAAGAAAAQLGLGYGLGVIAWQPVRDSAGEAIWLSSITWVLWLAATSTLVGALAARHLSTRASSNRAMDVAWRISISVAAAIGALLTVPLVMLPARSANRVDNFQPEVTAGAYAVIGVVIGLAVAIVAVNARVVATNIVASASWVWLVAVASAIDAVRGGRAAGTAQLGTWKFATGGWFRSMEYLPGALLMLGGALLIGVLAALPADRRQENRIAIAVSGAVGPALVAAAYFLSAPQLTVRSDLSAYLFAPYAVLAGLAGSALVAAMGPLRPRQAKPAPVAAGNNRTPDEWARDVNRTKSTSDKPEQTLRLDVNGEPPTVPIAATPATERAAKPAMEQTPKPAAGPAAKPAAKPVTKSATKPATKPAAKPAAEPANAAGAPTPADAAAPTATGRATVAQPLWPDRPEPRKKS